LIERQLGDGDGEVVLVLRTADFDLHGEGGVAEFLIVAVESASDDGAVGAVDVLLVREEVIAADVDDADGMGGLAFGLSEKLEVVVLLLDEIFFVFFICDDARVLGEDDDLVGTQAMNEERVEEDRGAEVFEAVGRGFGDFAGADHGEVALGNPELPGFTVADHVERHRTEKGHAEQDAKVLWLSDEDVSAEAWVGGFFALTAAACGGDDLDGRVHGLDGVEAGIDLFEEVAELGVKDDVGGAGLGDDAGMGQASGERRSQPNDRHRRRLSYPHEHKLQVYLSRLLFPLLEAVMRPLSIISIRFGCF
jgi:hypothetical protein